MQKVVAFIGPGGAGKSAQAEKIIEKYWLPNPSNNTTRKRRNDQDNDYTFVSFEKFAEKLRTQELRNCVTFKGNLYGFDKDTFAHPKILLPSILPQTIIEIHGHLLQSKWELFTIFFELSEEGCIERMRKRWDPENVIKDRVEADKVLRIYGKKLADTIIQCNRSIEEIFAEVEPKIDEFFER